MNKNYITTKLFFKVSLSRRFVLCITLCITVKYPLRKQAKHSTTDNITLLGSKRGSYSREGNLEIVPWVSQFTPRKVWFQ